MRLLFFNRPQKRGLQFDCFLCVIILIFLRVNFFQGKLFSIKLFTIFDVLFEAGASYVVLFKFD